MDVTKKKYSKLYPQVETLCAFCSEPINGDEYRKLDGYIGHKPCVEKRLERRKRLNLNMRLINRSPSILDKTVGESGSDGMRGRVYRKSTNRTS